MNDTTEPAYPNIPNAQKMIIFSMQYKEGNNITNNAVVKTSIKAE